MPRVMKSRIGEHVPAKPFWQILVHQRFEYDAAREFTALPRLGPVTQEGTTLVLWARGGQEVITRYQFEPSGRQKLTDPERKAYALLTEL